MNALVASVIRTILPIAVGQVASWLLLLHIVLPESATVGLSAFLGGLLSAIYYVGVRVLEQQWPYVGVLLGLPSSPDTYSKSTVTAAVPAAPTTAPGPVDIVTGPALSGVIPDEPIASPVPVDVPVTVAPDLATPAQ